MTVAVNDKTAQTTITTTTAIILSQKKNVGNTIYAPLWRHFKSK